MKKLLAAVVVASLMFLFARAPCLAEPAVIAERGAPRMAVVVADGASDQVRTQAARLAAILQQITGAEFPVTTGDGRAGLALGLADDFPQLTLSHGGRPVPWQPDSLQHGEDYLLQTHAGGVRLIGASPLAVRHATWDFLHRVGYRQYFPGANWEIVPSHPTLTADIDTFEHPSYYARRIWYGFGPWDYAREPYREWCEKNRCITGIELHTGHAYDGILARNRAEFAEHPEYLGLVGGERKSTKFCISNPGLRELVARDALAQFAASPQRHSISIDPSDGGGWCECEQCAKLGSVTDRAVTLANAVAEAVEKEYPGKLIGMYAYNQHSPPPSIQAHPNVVISVATAFITGGYSVDQLLEGWSQRASTLGIREYYSVSTWDRDLPGAARGGNLSYLQRTIPHFHARSARYLSAESSDNWGPNGLGYYLAARMLWDIREAEQVDEHVARFLDDCFGSAREPMSRFYELLDSDRRQPLSDDLVGRMYRLLSEARELTDDEAVRSRIDDLTLYTRYVELWLDYSVARDAARQAAFEAMIRHIYRMRETMLVHAYALYRDVAARDKGVSLPENARFNVAADKNPWKEDRPFSDDELSQLRSEGIARRPLLDFTPVSFSSDLVPAAPLKLTSSKLGSMGIYSRAPRIYYSWVEQAPAVWNLQATAGIIYNTRGTTRIDLYPAAEAEGKSVAQAEIEPTRQAEAVQLKSDFTGLHRLEIVAGGGAQVTWDEERPMTIESSFERPGGFHGRWALYFYVPRGTPTVGGFSHGEGRLLNADGELVQTFDRKPGYFSVGVPAGQDGRLWKFEFCAGDKQLMTVPPYLARSAEELLLPREVVERDQAGR